MASSWAALTVLERKQPLIGYCGHMVNKALPDVRIYRGILNRGVGENNGRRVDPVVRVRWQICQPVQVSVAATSRVPRWQSSCACTSAGVASNIIMPNAAVRLFVRLNMYSSMMFFFCFYSAKGTLSSQYGNFKWIHAQACLCRFHKLQSVF